MVNRSNQDVQPKRQEEDLFHNRRNWEQREDDYGKLDWSTTKVTSPPCNEEGGYFTSSPSGNYIICNRCCQNGGDLCELCHLGAIKRWNMDEWEIRGEIEEWRSHSDGGLHEQLARLESSQQRPLFNLEDRPEF